MRTFKTLAFGAALAAVASASDVEILTKDSFPDFVTDNDLVLAECQFPPILRNFNLEHSANTLCF